MSILFTIDPGVSGAIAEFCDGSLFAVHDPADKGLAPVLADLLVEALGEHEEVRVVIEWVNGLPGQSGPAAFNFGKGFGELIGVCLALDADMHLVRPNIWKAGVGLRGTGLKQSDFKKLSLDLARRTWPSVNWFARVKDEGRAEAALIGLYTLNQGLAD